MLRNEIQEWCRMVAKVVQQPLSFFVSSPEDKAKPLKLFCHSWKKEVTLEHCLNSCISSGCLDSDEVAKLQKTSLN